jgi:flagellar biosynthesis component FlhA
MIFLKGFTTILLLIIAFNSNAQRAENLQDSVRKAMVSSTGQDIESCKGHDIALFSIFISFDSEAKVEEVYFSESNNCFVNKNFRIKSNLIRELEKMLNTQQ